MLSEKRSIKTNSFIHFGCWNNGLCDKKKGTNDVSKVMNELNKYARKNINFISIAGDNYYPEKIKKEKEKEKEESGKKEENGKKEKGKKKEGDKIKIIHTNELVSGFNCLPDNVEINMILGNHDLETNISNKEQLYIEDENQMEDMNNCFILNTEITKARKKHINFVLQKIYELSENTLIIMIDTSMYEDDAINYIPCYNEYFQKNGVIDLPITNIIDLQNMQQKYIIDLQKLQRDNILHKLEELNKTYSNIIIIGHHPITGWKKKNKNNILIHPPIKFIELLMSIYKKHPSSKYYYLCADLHLYQQGTIKIDDKMVIEQYIVGTGGAELDTAIDVEPGKTINSDMNILSYEMKQNIRTNGFLHCIENGKQLCFKFIDVNNNSIIKNNCNSNSFDRYSRKSKSNKNSKLPKTIGGKKRRTIKTNNIKTI
jgi:predicted CopG family antitoxin